MLPAIYTTASVHVRTCTCTTIQQVTHLFVEYIIRVRSALEYFIRRRLLPGRRSPAQEAGHCHQAGWRSCWMRGLRNRLYRQPPLLCRCSGMSSICRIETPQRWR